MFLTKCHLGDHIKKSKMAGACIRYGGEERYTGLVGKPEVKRPLGNHKHRWEVSIEMELQELGGDVVFNGMICLRIGVGGRLL